MLRDVTGHLYRDVLHSLPFFRWLDEQTLTEVGLALEVRLLDLTLSTVDAAASFTIRWDVQGWCEVCTGVRFVPYPQQRSRCREFGWGLENKWPIKWSEDRQIDECQAGE